MDSAVEMIDIGEGLMREEVAFQIAPGSLDVVQFRSVFRQPFDGQPIAHGERSLRGFAGMDRAVVEHEDDGLVRAAGAWPVDRVEAAEEGDEIATALGSAGADDQLMSGVIEGADYPPLLGLPRRLDPQIAAAFGPGTGEVGVGERFRLVAEQQGDIAGFGLLLQQMQAQAGAIDRVGVLPALQRVARPTPGKAPLYEALYVKDSSSAVRVGCTTAELKRYGIGLALSICGEEVPHHLISGR